MNHQFGGQIIPLPGIAGQRTPGSALNWLVFLASLSYTYSKDPPCQVKPEVGVTVFIQRKCPNCGARNTYNLNELERRDIVIEADIAAELGREYLVTCRNCGQDFVIFLQNDDRSDHQA